MPKIKLANDSFPIDFTNLSRVFYPQAHVTKQDLANYYLQVKDWILPYVKNRPLTLVRCPGGVGAECFYQKHLGENQDEYLYPIKIKENEGSGIYSYLKDIKGILALVQIGVLEIHVWGSNIKDIEKPNTITFDLDPAPDVTWKQVINTAHLMREALESLKLVSFVKTTGGKGLHVVVPIQPKKDWDEIKEFSHAFVNSLVELYPNDYVAVMTKAKRKGKIFIDYLRNQRGATAVVAYSTRAKENASVSMPIAWKQLTTKIKADQFTVKNAIDHLSKLKQDPWEEYLSIKQSIKF